MSETQSNQDVGAMLLDNLMGGRTHEVPSDPILDADKEEDTDIDADESGEHGDTDADTSDADNLESSGDDQEELKATSDTDVFDDIDKTADVDKFRNEHRKKTKKQMLEIATSAESAKSKAEADLVTERAMHQRELNVLRQQVEQAVTATNQQIQQTNNTVQDPLQGRVDEDLVTVKDLRDMAAQAPQEKPVAQDNTGVKAFSDGQIAELSKLENLSKLNEWSKSNLGNDAQFQNLQFTASKVFYALDKFYRTQLKTREESAFQRGVKSGAKKAQAGVRGSPPNNRSGQSTANRSGAEQFMPNTGLGGWLGRKGSSAEII